jgi:sulfur carrier protein ThiS
MSARPATTEKTEVTLIRQGVGREEYTLPEGATLADLLRKAQAQKEGQVIYIDGKPLEEQIILRPGMIITTVTMKGKAARDEPWRESIGMFHGDPEFRELVEAVEAAREAEKDRS